MRKQDASVFIGLLSCSRLVHESKATQSDRVFMIANADLESIFLKIAFMVSIFFCIIDLILQKFSHLC